jgi:hypothetical protein
MSGENLFQESLYGVKTVLNQTSMSSCVKDAGHSGRPEGLPGGNRKVLSRFEDIEKLLRPLGSPI